MSPFISRPAATTPWGNGTPAGSGEQPGRDEAPRREVTYECNRDCRRSPFVVPFAAGATPPAAVDCRCGGTGRRKGARRDASVELPGYVNRGQGSHRPAVKDDVTPMAQLLKRRSRKEGARLLAERMAQVRRQGVAR